MCEKVCVGVFLCVYDHPSRESGFVDSIFSVFFFFILNFLFIFFSPLMLHCIFFFVVIFLK